MTLIQLLLLVMSAMTNSPESKSLAQADNKSTCGIHRLNAFDMMLTCYFHDNISALQKDFTVYLYKGETSPMTVVSCEWTPQFFCYVAPGYKYEYDIDVNHDHTKVRLLHANTEHVGMYTCQVIGESDAGTCNFTKEQILWNSTLTPNTQQTSMTVPAQTTTTSSLPDDRQTQSADEQSSVASKLSTPKDAPGGSLAEEQKQTGTQDNTVVVVVPSVVLSVLLGIAIIAIIFAAYWRRRQRRSSTTVNERSDKKKREEETILLKKRQQDEHHSDSSPPNPEDGQLTAQEDRQQTPVESGRQHETEVKTRCKTDGDSCLEADSKPLMSESFELEKTGIQELGDVDVEDDETSFDGRQPELQQRDSHIDAPKKLNKEEEEDSPVPLHFQHDM
ncbi:uncharacterized protein LOC112567698 isoform X8 [Pomacea canaliculata]|uniref:uncharacterized protein LOC112567698 isoform X8 n=1 Tax=Pomacea canaliculata TaxID=400727 RepID=UPI000D736363|nr:uncharacterized protein LOC112567698 isoform X8 [Pomacea canaliculata]XP_025100244.1 uncharacterized protein LOC112567698 isoform X8 [Pomacea canaliculata]XP_025100245.1 uncharacterized protein LOC112567698 isoform X8 [Pomacea canaliculata]